MPSTLALFDLSEPLVWKLSALLFGLPMLALLLTFQRRRIAATGHSAPPSILIVMIGLGSLSLVAMMTGYAYAGAYATALLFNFLTLAYAFVVALEVILRERADRKP